MSMKLQTLLLISVALSLSPAPILSVGAKKQGAARKEDVPYIKCQVCQKLASELYKQVEKKQTEVAPKKISEYHVIEIAENVCNLKKAEANWILKIDIVEQGDELKVESFRHHENQSILLSKTWKGSVTRSARRLRELVNRSDYCLYQDKVMGYSDTDVAEYLYTNKPKLESLENFLCEDLTKACNAKPPPVPKDRVPGEPFTPKTAKEAEIERIMKSMEGMPGGGGMKMYSREQLINQGFGEDDEDEDDEDDTHINSKLKQAMQGREKATTERTWKEKAITGIKDTAATLKRHANKVSNKVGQWWNAKKVGHKKSKSNKEEL